MSPSSPSSSSPSTSMPPPLPLPPLTLIVATTTPSLGIGLHGTLPWPPLKSDLAFFARVTKRPPPPSLSHPPTFPSTTASTQTTVPSRNAVIMGRKTWESLPEKARPLKGRVNVVVSRDEKKGRGWDEGGDVLRVGGIEEGLRGLRERFSLPAPGGAEGEGGEKDAESLPTTMRLGRVFVIGGAEIYRVALGMGCCERILWTRLRGEWECDVFFPGGVLPVGEEEEGVGGWARRSRGEMERWVGEEGVGGVRREGGVEFEVFMLERVERRGRGVEG